MMPEQGILRDDCEFLDIWFYGCQINFKCGIII